MNQDRITIDPLKMNGQPCIRGLRITVSRLVSILAVSDWETIRQDYPELELEDFRQAVEYQLAKLTSKEQP